jgi:hypothetical protein
VLWLAHQQIDDILIVNDNLRHAVDPEEELGAANAAPGDLLIRVRDLDLASCRSISRRLSAVAAAGGRARPRDLMVRRVTGM